MTNYIELSDNYYIVEATKIHDVNGFVITKYMNDEIAEDMESYTIIKIDKEESDLIDEIVKSTINKHKK